MGTFASGLRRRDRLFAGGLQAQPDVGMLRALVGDDFDTRDPWLVALPGPATREGLLRVVIPRATPS